MNTRKALRALTLLAVALATLALAAPSSVSAAPALSGALTEQMTRHPGGTAINDHTVSYAGGNVLVDVAPTRSGTPDAAFDCGGGWLCLWQDDNFTGTRWQFRSEGYIQDLDPWGASPFYSFYNNRNHRWFLHQGSGGNGATACYQAGAKVSAMNPAWAQSKSIYLATSNNRCGS